MLSGLDANMQQVTDAFELHLAVENPLAGTICGVRGPSSAVLVFIREHY